MTVPPVPLVAVTDHAAERFRQRVGTRTGALDVKAEIATRVVRAWEVGRVDDEPPPGASGARGSLYVRDLVDRAVVFVCRYDRAGREALVITLWEGDDGVAPPRVARRYTNALKATDPRRSATAAAQAATADPARGDGGPGRPASAA